MNDFPSENPLQLEVTNFGPVAKAEIELRPLTVFVGPSNTGKSYLAILAYALHRFFSHGQRSGDWDWFPRDIELNGKNKIPAERLNELAKWAKKEMFEDASTLSEKGSATVPEPCADLIRSTFTRFNSLGNHVAREVNRCFGISDARALIREGSRGGAQVVLRRHIPEDSRPFVHKLRIGVSDTELDTFIPEEIPMRLYSSRFLVKLSMRSFFTLDQLSERSTQNEEIPERNARKLIGELTDYAMRHVVGSLDSPAFYLPADRTGVMHAHSVVVSALIEKATTAGMGPATSTPALSGVLGDFLKHLVEMGTRRHENPYSIEKPQPRNKRFSPDKQIEENILGGLVKANESESGYPFFTYRPKGWRRKGDLPLMSASSMVSELAPVVLYLRHIVRAGNLLIIEEPESHLHPAMQVEFARQIAGIVNSGIKVIVTTHSEWLLDELANLVQLSGLSKNRRKGIQGNGFALRPEQVGAWLFEPKLRPKGSVVKEIPLDESGLFPSKFDDVALALHNNWAEISSRAGKNR